ncbi:hypothetical protein FB446DRAFT_707738 [Lentinula raphanica]|nr:hypothetical protein FB446DRAFT_707738 [Lentinula raphanica]
MFVRLLVKLTYRAATVWMADGRNPSKCTSDEVSDSGRLTKKTKTASKTTSKVGSQKAASTKSTVKSVRMIEEDLDKFTDDEDELQESDHPEELDHPEDGSNDEMEDMEDVYSFNGADLNAEVKFENSELVQEENQSKSLVVVAVKPVLDDNIQASSDAPSSTFEMSLVSNNDDDDDDKDDFNNYKEQAKKKQSIAKVLNDDDNDNGIDDIDNYKERVKKKQSAVKTTARDIKYESKRPSMAPAPLTTTAKKAVAKRTKETRSTTDDPNAGWPTEAHLNYPDGTKMQWTISLHIQPQAIQDILHKAITLASGLSMFEEAFPTSAQQLAQSYKSIVSTANSLSHPHIADRVTGRVGKMRVNVKEAAVNIVPGVYGILRVPTEDGERKEFVKSLLTKMNFIFPRKTITDANTVLRNEPYLHPAIIAVLHNFFFKGPNKTDDAKEVPQAMLSLVVIAVFAAIKEWEGGKDERDKQEFVASTFSDQYTLHATLLNEKIRNSNVGDGVQKYHTLMARLYREAKSGSATATDVASTLMPDIDLAGSYHWGTNLTKYSGGPSVETEVGDVHCNIESAPLDSFLKRGPPTMRIMSKI